MSPHIIHPTNEFIRFEKQEIEQSIPDRFEKQVSMHAGRLAVKTRNCGFTYRELNEEANRVSHAILSERGEEAEPIALLLENDAPMIACILAALKAGKIYVPLDPMLPDARTSYILEDSQARLIVTNDENLAMAQRLSGDAIPIVNIDHLATDLPSGNPHLQISPDALTWILYTSGSTGQPKGVIHTHRNVLHFVMNYTNNFHVCADDRYALLFSCSVNAGAHVIFTSLLSGASIFLMDIRKEGLSNLADWLIQNEITLYSSVPTLFQHFANPLNGSREFPKLRLIKMMGEPVYGRHVDLYRKHFSENCIFVNRLGSTETGSIRWNFIDRNTEIEGTNVPVGYPVEDNEILILNDDREETAPGEAGEIAVRSRYLSPGYWRKPDRTEAAFLPDPEGGDKRIYCTGDLGRMLPDGSLVHLGRKDFQIKIRGYRIEAAEIEMALLGMESIKDAVVIALEDGSDDLRLVAYLVLEKRPAPNVSEMRKFLADRLPDYMIPSKFVIMDEIPTLPNGKIDRRSLPAPGQSRPDLETPFIAPNNLLEEHLAEIWSEVMGLDQVGVQDNFLDLGGNSLLAAQIISRVVKTFQIKVSMKAFFKSATIADMASVISQNLPKNQQNKDWLHTLPEI